MPKIARLTLATGLALILLLMLVTATLAGLLASESGTRWLAGLAVDRLGADARWGQLRGSMLASLEISDLTLDQPGFSLAAEKARITWHPRSLLRGELKLGPVTVEDAVLVLREDETIAKSESAFDPADLRLPVDVSISGVTLNRLTLGLPGREDQAIDTLALTARIAGDDLEIAALELRLPEGGLSLSGSAGLRSDMPVELNLLADGPLPVESGAGGAPTQRQVAGALSLSGRVDWREGVAADLTYRISAQGIATIAPDLPDRIAASGRLKGHQRGDLLEVEAASLALEDTGLLMNLRGQVAGANTADPSVSAELHWEGLHWPLASAAPRLRSDAGRISVDGRADDYRLDVAASAEGTDLPDSHWTARAQGDAERLLVDVLLGELLDGSLEISGSIGFDPQPAWDLRLAASGINPGVYLPEVTAPLEGSLSMQGLLDAEGHPSVGVRIDELRTNAAGFPLVLDGVLQLDGDVLTIARLNLLSGSGELAGDGSLSARHLDLNWTVAVSDAGSFVPGARGRIDGGGRLSGHPEKPQLDTTLTAAGLGVDGLALDDLTLELLAGLADDAPLAARLSLQGLNDQGEPVLDRVTLDIDGRIADHRLNLSMSAPDTHLNAELEGGLSIAEPAWQGRLLTLAAGTAELGTWNLESPPSLALAADELHLGTVCLNRRSGAGRLCLDGGWQSSGPAGLELELSALPTEAFVPALTGELSGVLKAALDAGGALTADGRLELGSGAVRLPDDLDARALAHGGGHLNLAVDGTGLHAEADFAAPEEGRVDLELRLPALHAVPLAPFQPIEGRIRAALPDLAILAALIEPIGDSAGQLRATVDLAGSLDAPRFDGDFRLEDGAATLPVAGLDLQEIQLRLAHEADNPELLTLTGGLRSGSGRLEATGVVDPGDGAARIRLRGEALRAFATADARVLVSPDLTLNWSQDLLRIRGLLSVPRAEITPRLKIGAATADTPAIGGQPGVLVGPSPDVVILGQESTPDTAATDIATPLRIDAQVGLVLGPDVTVNAVGLVTRLEGGIGFSLKPDQRDLLPLARGGIALVDGTFRSFGQDLDIETGRVLYAGVPVTEPEVFLRAVRWIDSDPAVSAVGVQVSGPGASPELELFSRPQLDTAEIQSYLLTGTGTGENSSVLTIGTQLTDRVYVSYGYNLLEETSEFDALFSITPRYGLGADVGEADSNFNLMFTYEK